MTMLDLYDDMKAVLKLYGLNFHEMDQVEIVEHCDGGLWFKHDGRQVQLKTPEDRK